MHINVFSIKNSVFFASISRYHLRGVTQPRPQTGVPTGPCWQKSLPRRPEGHYPTDLVIVAGILCQTETDVLQCHSRKQPFPEVPRNLLLTTMNLRKRSQKQLHLQLSRKSVKKLFEKKIRRKLLSSPCPLWRLTMVGMVWFLSKKY